MKHSNMMVNRLKAYLTPTFTIRLREKRLEDIFLWFFFYDKNKYKKGILKLCYSISRIVKKTFKIFKCN